MAAPRRRRCTGRAESSWMRPSIQRSTEQTRVSPAARRLHGHRSVQRRRAPRAPPDRCRRGCRAARRSRSRPRPRHPPPDRAAAVDAPGRGSGPRRCRAGRWCSRRGRRTSAGLRATGTRQRRERDPTETGDLRAAGGHAHHCAPEPATQGKSRAVLRSVSEGVAARPLLHRHPLGLGEGIEIGVRPASPGTVAGIADPAERRDGLVGDRLVVDVNHAHRDALGQ